MKKPLPLPVSKPQPPPPQYPIEPLGTPVDITDSATPSATRGSDKFCKVCDQWILAKTKGQYNWKRHLKTKKHRDNAHNQISSQDEDEPTRGDASCISIVVRTSSSEPRPGQHFFFYNDQDPVKYKVAEHVSRNMNLCTVCDLRFRNGFHLLRHKREEDYIVLEKHLREAEGCLRDFYKRKHPQPPPDTTQTEKESETQPVVDDEEIDINVILSDIILMDVDSVHPDLYDAYMLVEEYMARITCSYYVIALVICNEFSSQDLPYSHSHAYIKTGEAYFFF